MLVLAKFEASDIFFSFQVMAATVFEIFFPVSDFLSLFALENDRIISAENNLICFSPNFQMIAHSIPPYLTGAASRGLVAHSCGHVAAQVLFFYTNFVVYLFFYPWCFTQHGPISTSHLILSTVWTHRSLIFTEVPPKPTTAWWN